MKPKKQKYNKYEQPIEAVLDLHGFTQREAEDAVISFLQKMKAKRFHKVLIITGKGLHSADKAVLRDFVERFLHQQGFSFQKAKYNEGGDGALEIRL